MKLKKNVNEYDVITLSIVFILIVILHKMIFMSFDDYGYGALCYVVGDKFNPNGGVNYSVIDIFKFLKETYFIWAGRILGQFFLIKCLQIGEWFIQLVQSGIILGTLLFGVKAFCKEKDYIKKLLLTLAIFFCIPFKVLQLSLFWYSASVIYFWPFIFFVIGIFLLKRKNNITIKAKILLNFIIFILGIASGLSQEQVGLGFCGFMFVVILWDYIMKNKLISSDKIIFFIGLIIGYIILIIAPGNFSRMANNTSNGILEKNSILLIITALKNIMPNLLIMTKSLIYVFMVIFSIILMYKRNFRITYIQKIKKIVLYILIFTQFLLFMDTSQYSSNIIYLIQIINIAAISVAIIMISFLYEEQILAGLIVAAMSSLFPIIVSPYFVDRMFMPAYVFYVFILIILIDKMEIFEKDTYQLKKISYYIIGSMGIISYSLILCGYFENSIPRNINNNILSDEVKKLDEYTNDNKVIYLYRNINETYTGTQPYVTDYTQAIKSYYKIPQNVKIAFENFPEQNPFKALYLTLKGGNLELQKMKFIPKIDAANDNGDFSNLLYGAYPLEKYNGDSFYLIQKFFKCNLKNDHIRVDGLNIVLNIDKKSLLLANNKLGELEMNVYINGKNIKNVKINDGEQKISILPNELPKVTNGEYIVELQSNCDFSPANIWKNGDTRIVFGKLKYIGSEK